MQLDNIMKKIIDNIHSTSTPLRRNSMPSGDAGYVTLLGSSDVSDSHLQSSVDGEDKEYNFHTHFSSALYTPPGKYYGRRYLDIIQQTYDYDKSQMLIRLIFSHINQDDIKNVRLVNKKWNHIVESLKIIKKEPKPTIIIDPLDKENYSQVKKIPICKSSCGVLYSRPLNSTKIPEYTPTVHPEDKLNPCVREWWEAAKKCVGRESLQPCPMCRGPAVRRYGTWPDQLFCQRPQCRSVVCVACCLPHNPSQQCPTPILRNPRTGRVEISPETLGSIAASSSSQTNNKLERALLRRL